MLGLENRWSAPPDAGGQRADRPAEVCVLDLRHAYASLARRVDADLRLEKTMIPTPVFGPIAAA
jgi:hypothetical protein